MLYKSYRSSSILLALRDQCLWTVMQIVISQTAVKAADPMKKSIQVTLHGCATDSTGC